MVNEFEKAHAAKEASEGAKTPAEAPASGGPQYAAISAENDDEEISDLDAGDGQKNILAAQAVLASGNTGGEDSEENRRQLKVQCTEAEKAAKGALAASTAGIALAESAPHSG